MILVAEYMIDETQVTFVVQGPAGATFTTKQGDRGFISKEEENYSLFLSAVANI